VLAARYRVPILCKDTIKEPLLDILGAHDSSESRQLSDASFAILFALVREFLSAGTDLILEGNFRPGEHAPVLQTLILDSARTQTPSDARAPAVTAPRVTQVLCRTSEPIRIARLKARATDPTRHAGHRDADLATATSPPLDFLALPGERLVFDSDARSAAEVDPTRLHHLLEKLDHSQGLTAHWHGLSAKEP